MNKIIRVLIVDDSAYVRKVVREMLSYSPHLEVVGAARDGREALELVESLHPDVVTSDLMMPELDGIGFVREQMQRRALPIVREAFLRSRSHAPKSCSVTAIRGRRFKKFSGCWKP